MTGKAGGQRAEGPSCEDAEQAHPGQREQVELRQSQASQGERAHKEVVPAASGEGLSPGHSWTSMSWAL